MSTRSQITTLETAYLRDITKLLKILISATINGGGGTPLRLSFTIGDGQPNTPTNGSIDYQNAFLADKTINPTSGVFKNGVGWLAEGLDYDLIVDGGIELLGGAVFSTGEKYVIFYS